MKLPPDVVRYLVIGHVFITVFINIAVNVCLGVLAFGGSEFVSTWAADKGAAADSIGTCFFLPFITCLIATPIVRYQSSKGFVGRVSTTDVPQWLLAFRGPIFVRSLKFGICGLLIFAGPVFLAYLLMAPDVITTGAFLAIKPAFAAVLGMPVTPLIALVELAQESPDSA